MRIIYITGCMPYGKQETFIIDEIDELLLRHDVLIIPRSPGSVVPHAHHLLPHTRRSGLMSREVLLAAIRSIVRRPRSVLSTIATVMRSRSVFTALKNLAVVPKGIWLADVARAWRADHIHCHWAGTTATMTLIGSKLSGVPWSLTAHRSDIVSDNLLSEKSAAASLVRTISEDGRRMMIERGVESSPKVRVLPMGVRIPAETIRQQRTTAAVLCPADFLEVKGHRYLLRAWQLLMREGLEAELWLAGYGPLRSTLEEFARTLGIERSVRFLGMIPHPALLNFYEQGQIAAVALASIDLGAGCHEGIPIALVEAMSYGIPIVATTTGGIPELVKANTGLLVPPKDEVALAAALSALLKDEALARTVGVNARRHVAGTRDIRHIVSQLESCFSSERTR